VPKVPRTASFAHPRVFVDAVRDLRDRTLRAVTREEHLFHDAQRHKAIVTYLFVELWTAPADEQSVAQQFYECYRHLVEGGRLDELPLRIIPQADVVRALRRILRGDEPQLARMTSQENSHDDDDDERRDEGEGPPREGLEAGEEVRIQVRRVG
jgi:hypothetical protein